MNATQNEIWDVLSELTGEEVLRVLTNWHGLQLLDDGLKEFLMDEGLMEP